MSFWKVFKTRLGIFLPSDRVRFYGERHYYFADRWIYIRRSPVNCLILLFSCPFKQRLPNRSNSGVAANGAVSFLYRKTAVRFLPYWCWLLERKTLHRILREKHHGNDVWNDRASDHFSFSSGSGFTASFGNAASYFWSRKHVAITMPWPTWISSACLFWYRAQKDSPLKSVSSFWK